MFKTYDNVKRRNRRKKHEIDLCQEHLDSSYFQCINGNNQSKPSNREFSHNHHSWTIPKRCNQRKKKKRGSWRSTGEKIAKGKCYKEGCETKEECAYYSYPNIHRPTQRHPSIQGSVSFVSFTPFHRFFFLHTNSLKFLVDGTSTARSLKHLFRNENSMNKHSHCAPIEWMMNTTNQTKH